MKNLLIRTSIAIAALAAASAACAAEFVVPVDIKNVGGGWTDAVVLCTVQAQGGKLGSTNVPLVNGAFKGNVNVSVYVPSGELNAAGSWKCTLAVGVGNQIKFLTTGGGNGYNNQPGTAFKVEDTGIYVK
nr:hypothetical protein [Rhodoferax sp.]